MVKADLHLHTNHSPDSLITVDKLVQRCLQIGIDCLAVTEHNTIDGALAVQRAAPFKVIIGEEVKTSEGEVIGLFLRQNIPGGLSAEETVKQIKEQGGLVCLPHPFDRLRREPLRAHARESIRGSIDIVEVLNGRVTFREDNRRASRFARELGVPGSAGSDAHSLREVGSVYVEMAEFETPEQFLGSLRQGKVCGGVSSPLVHLTSTWAKVYRRIAGRSS